MLRVRSVVCVAALPCALPSPQPALAGHWPEHGVGSGSAALLLREWGWDYLAPWRRLRGAGEIDGEALISLNSQRNRFSALRS